MTSNIISNLYLTKKKIFIDGIPLNTTKTQIINFFKQYGEVDYCVINTEKYTNLSRGFGFLIFKNSISVKYCLNDRKNHYINGKWIEVKKANNKKKRKKNFFDVKKIIYPIYDKKKKKFNVKKNFLGNNNYLNNIMINNNINSITNNNNINKINNNVIGNNININTFYMPLQQMNLFVYQNEK